MTNKNISDKHPNKNTVSDDSSDKKLSPRRKLLGALAAGSGIVAGSKVAPDSWTKPLTSTIVVPAHGQTTTSATTTASA